jgi:hypothetical protein
MATTTLRYLQDDDDDPLNDLLGGGGEPSVPNASSAPAPSYDPTPPEPDHSLDESLLQDAPPEEPPPSAAPQQTPPRDDLDAVRSMIGQRNDPELDAAYRNAQLDALKHGGFDDGKYGVGEAVRDNGAALIASILDIGFNKGRGLGGIVGATANEVGRQEAQRAKQRENARDFALKMRPKDIDPVTQYLALGRLGVSQQNAGTSANRVAGTEAWRGQQSDPESALSRTKVTQAGRTAAASTGARQDVEHENNPRTAQDQALIAGAKTAAELGEQHNAAPQMTQDAADRSAAEQGARIQTDLAYAPQTTGAAAAKAGAVAQAQIAPELAKQQGMNPILADRSNNGVGAGLSAEGLMRANQGLDVADPQLLQQAMKTRQINQKTLDDIKAANRGAEIVQRLHDTAETYQSLITNDPTAIAGPQAAELRRQYKAHAEEYAGVIGKVSGNNSLTSHKEALDLIPDLHNPYATDGIKGLWSPLEANINGNLGAIGIRAKPPAFLGGGQAQPGAAPTGADPPPPAAAAPPQSAAMPGYSTDYSDPRTSLGARQAVPPKPAGVNFAPGGGALHHIRNPRTGKVVPTMMDPDQLKPALAAGWQVVD